MAMTQMQTGAPMPMRWMLKTDSISTGKSPKRWNHEKEMRVSFYHLLPFNRILLKSISLEVAKEVWFVLLGEMDMNKWT